ncbi:MAG: two-component sensor histidine kinase [Lachnospiraceae bacterium]|nr:two-component sensor histidine kinase [Lachnospiraceae bacterium]
MKNKIWQKYLICMAALIVLVGLSINLIGYRHASKAYEREHRERLQEECRTISVEYVKESRNAGLTSEQFQLQLTSVSNMVGCETWVVGNNGVILMATEKGMVDKRVPMSVLNENWNAKTKIEDLYDGKRALAVDSVLSGTDVWGYIVVSEPWSNITKDAKKMLFIVDMTALSFLIMGAVLWFVFAEYHTRNVRILQDAVVHYTNGDFDHEIKIRTRDEYRDLANSIHLLADQHANLVEYQKNFIANISHDFRSPLTSIKGYAEAIKDGTIPYEIQGKYLNIILFETDRLANLTNDLLDLSNFENKGVHLSFTDFDITKMLKQSAMTFEGKCSQKNLKIRLSFPENTLIVHADKGKIQQVVHNLIDNAIKFSHPDGIIYVSVMERKEKVLVSVRDTGIGIPKESISKVWERFYKTDLSRGKDKRGTGLGLSITKQIIAAHNENIKVSSTEGVGTEFTFSLAKAEE